MLPAGRPVRTKTWQVREHGMFRKVELGAEQLGTTDETREVNRDNSLRAIYAFLKNLDFSS